MKHQISKVALMATLAFIGIGFAGTQQAKATDCPPHEFFEDEKDCQKDAAPGRICYPSVIYPTPSETGFYDTDGDCFAETKYERTVRGNACYINATEYYNCTSTTYSR